MNNYIKANKPAGDEWTRPNNFPPIPVAEEQEVSFLMRLGGDYDNDFIFGFQPVGNDVDIWIDGNLFDTVLDGTQYVGTIKDTDYGVFYKGIKWCWIIIRPVVGQDLKQISLFTLPNPINPSYYDVEILEINIDMPYCDVRPFIGPLLSNSYLQFRYVEHINFKSFGLVTDGRYMFQTFYELRHVSNFDSLTANMTNVERMFQRTSKFAPRVFNFQNVVHMYNMALFNGRVCDTYTKFITSPSLSSIQSMFGSSGQAIRGIEITDCSNVTSAGGLVGWGTNLREAIFTDLSVDFRLGGCLFMSEEALLDMVDSLADLTGGVSQTIQLATTPNYPSVNAAANAKNWATTY